MPLTRYEQSVANALKPLDYNFLAQEIMDISHALQKEGFGLVPDSVKKDAVLEEKRRSIVGIAPDAHGFGYLCNDGSVWGYNTLSRRWTRLPDVPQDE